MEISNDAIIESQVEILKKVNDLLDELDAVGPCGCAEVTFLNHIAELYDRALLAIANEDVREESNKIFASQFQTFMANISQMYCDVLERPVA